tara:strand:+ start:116 stop:1162 length:1047 start_codon:yes stop_codon:yes gene_type:complete
MSQNTKIFSEAIAEAKSIRETAMVNAKLALEEAFAPRMQEMMSNKLESLAEEMEEDELQETADKDADGTMDEEISLEELIAELDSLEETSYTEEDETLEESVLEEAEDEDAVGEITVDELKDIIRDVVAGLMGGEEEMEDEVEAEDEMGAEDDDELNLDEILAELDSLNEGDMEEMEDMEEAMREPSDSAAAGAEELARMIKKLAAKTGKSFDAISQFLYGGKKATPAEFEEGVELQEALNTISILRSNLNEVNLLNAKLLYVNKLFKGRNLTEAQKVKVINAFDRAETVKETKNIFETLKESFTTIKNPIKESLSFASKPAGIAPNRQPIVEGDEFMKRMQKIAGII